MTTTAKSPQAGGPLRTGALDMVILVLTLLCWILLLVKLFAVAGKEARGDAGFALAMSWIFAMLFTALTWLFLGILLLKSSNRGAATALLYVASAPAAFASTYLLLDPARGWLAVVPVLLPPLLALRFRSPSGQVSLAAAIAILLLSVAPWPALFRSMSRRPAAPRRAAVADSAREANLVKLRSMKPAAPLSEWYALLDAQSGVREEALQALRRVPRRQADIKNMLAYGSPMAMILVPDLDLKPGPELCEAARVYLRKRAAEIRIEPPHDPVPYTAAGYVAESLPGVRWFQDNGCDCTQGIHELESAVETHLDSPIRQKTLASLAELATR
jgi:hypothetical protein